MIYQHELDMKVICAIYKITTSIYKNVAHKNLHENSWIRFMGIHSAT